MLLALGAVVGAATSASATPTAVRIRGGARWGQELYRLHVAHSRGHDQAEPLAELAAMDAERVKIPDTDDGRRLRPALRGTHPA
ncbi:hypothetical protein ACFVT2_39985 [Streptomyces sp. NPDC058000]|uniref:hypothetical protein n=1 Tax=Streptomyces sp. NPDC058000 TaxID=3346299 RepID=UPI0036E673AD